MIETVIPVSKNIEIYFVKDKEVYELKTNKEFFILLEEAFSIIKNYFNKITKIIPYFENENEIVFYHIHSFWIDDNVPEKEDDFFEYQRKNMIYYKPINLKLKYNIKERKIFLDYDANPEEQIDEKKVTYYQSKNETNGMIEILMKKLEEINKKILNIEIEFKKGKYWIGIIYPCGHEKMFIIKKKDEIEKYTKENSILSVITKANKLHDIEIDYWAIEMPEIIYKEFGNNFDKFNNYYGVDYESFVVVKEI